MRRVIRFFKILLNFTKLWKSQLQHSPGVKAAFEHMNDVTFINKYYEMSLASASAVSTTCNKILFLSYSLAIPLFLSSRNIVSIDNILGVKVTNPHALAVITVIAVFCLTFYYSLLQVKRELIFSRIDTALEHIDLSLASGGIYLHLVENGPYGLSAMLKNSGSSSFVSIACYLINCFATAVVILPVTLSFYTLFAGFGMNNDVSDHLMLAILLIIAAILSIPNIIYSLIVCVNHIQYYGFRGMRNKAYSTYQDAVTNVDHPFEPQQ